MGIIDRVKGIFNFRSKSFTESTVRPSIAQPYMATDTGAKLPIFPFPLIMIYELADNVDAIRIPIETVNREMFKNGFEIVEKWKFKCSNCSKEFQYAPLAGDTRDEQPNSTNEDNESTIGSTTSSKANKAQFPVRQPSNGLEGPLQCDTCGSTELLRPMPENRQILEKMLNSPVNANEQSLEDVVRMLE